MVNMVHGANGEPCTTIEANMKQEVIFTVTGFRPGFPNDCKRGVKVTLEDDITDEDFLDRYSRALMELYRHECDWLLNKALISTAAPTEQEIPKELI